MSNCVRSTTVCNSLIPVNRIVYGGKKLLNDSVSEVDPEVYLVMKNEKKRQRRGLELIASENFTSKAVNDALSSSLSNKYSEGYPGSRYYAGNEYIDQIERLCQQRALEVFGLDPEKWGVNVQPHSGSPANFAVYTALVEPHGRIMGLELSDGGHLSHGFYSSKKKVSASSIFFESLPYRVNKETGLIDYDELEKNALLFQPKLIIAGISCYSRWLDYARFRMICDKCNAYLMADMSHISGLVAGNVAPSPFEWADVVTTTTHKTLRGPRGAMIFYRKGVRYINSKNENILYDIGPKIDSAVFPGLQGGPHNHSIAGIAVALKQCLTVQFAEYAKQIIKNSQALANHLIKLGYHLSTGGTDNHLCLINLRLSKLCGSRIETILDLAYIACNKNTCPGDTNAFRPSGIRIGTPALTSRGFKEDDFIQVAEFIHQAIEVYRKYESKIGNTNKEFKQFIESDKNFIDDINVVADKVVKFSSQFDIPGNEFF